jgi:hypothetical protein
MSLIARGDRDRPGIVGTNHRYLTLNQVLVISIIWIVIQTPRRIAATNAMTTTAATIVAMSHTGSSAHLTEARALVRAITAADRPAVARIERRAPLREDGERDDIYDLLKFSGALVLVAFEKASITRNEIEGRT